MEANGNLELEEERREEGLLEDRPLGPFPWKPFGTRGSRAPSPGRIKGTHPPRESG